MRKPLYRAKAANREDAYLYRTSYENGDWVCGLVSKINEFRGTVTAEMTNEDGICGIDVDPNTICEFIGKYDKNGKKIFEGDILEYEIDRFCSRRAVVIWKDCQFLCRDVINRMITQPAFMDVEFEVIGNIFDNPELLECL